MHEAKVDLYDRQPFAEKLISQLLLFKSPFSVGIDAKWGDGKTHFVNAYLKPACDTRKIPVVIYDCFEHERETDPFVSLTREIIDLASKYRESTAAATAIDKATKKTASFVWGLGKTAIKAGSKMLLKQSIEELQGNFDDSPDSADSEQELVSFIEEQLQFGGQIKSLKKEFTSSITSLIEEISTSEKSIVVVIDELDRCRPNHAINILESIKHLLSIEGIYFVITYDKKQLCGSLKCVYGSELDANLYLQKFINLNCALKTKPFSQAHRSDALINEFISKMKHKDKDKDFTKDMIQYHDFISSFHQLSLREVERCAFNYLSLFSSGKASINHFTIVLITILEVKYGDLLAQLNAGLYRLPAELCEKYKLIELFNKLESSYPHVATRVKDDIGYLFIDSDNRTQTQVDGMLHFVKLALNAGI